MCEKVKSVLPVSKCVVKMLFNWEDDLHFLVYFYTVIHILNNVLNICILFDGNKLVLHVLLYSSLTKITNLYTLCHCQAILLLYWTLLQLANILLAQVVSKKWCSEFTIGHSGHSRTPAFVYLPVFPSYSNVVWITPLIQNYVAL